MDSELIKKQSLCIEKVLEHFVKSESLESSRLYWSVCGNFKGVKRDAASFIM